MLKDESAFVLQGLGEPVHRKALAVSPWTAKPFLFKEKNDLTSKLSTP